MNTGGLPLWQVTSSLYYLELVMEYHTLNGSRIRLTAERDTTLFTFSVVMLVSLVTALVAIAQIIALVIGD